MYKYLILLCLLGLTLAIPQRTGGSKRAKGSKPGGREPNKPKPYFKISQDTSVIDACKTGRPDTYGDLTKGRYIDACEEGETNIVVCHLGPREFKSIVEEFPDEEDRADVDLAERVFKHKAVNCAVKNKKSQRGKASKEEKRKIIRVYRTKIADKSCQDQDFKNQLDINDIDEYLKVGYPSDNLDCSDSSDDGQRYEFCLLNPNIVFRIFGDDAPVEGTEIADLESGFESYFEETTSEYTSLAKLTFIPRFVTCDSIKADEPEDDDSDDDEGDVAFS